MRSLQSMPLMTPLHAPFNPPLLPAMYGVLGLMHPQANTWNGEPCPVHGSSLLPQPGHHHLPISMTPFPPPFPPPIYSSMSMRRAASVHELAAASGIGPAMYGTLPGANHRHHASLTDHNSIMMVTAAPPGMMAGGRAVQSRHPLPPMPPPSLLPPEYEKRPHL